MQINETPWGTEEVVASNDLYCAVRLHIKAGNALPMVFHQRHDKTWYILRGQVLVRRINLSMGKIAGQRLVAGENVRIWPLLAAQLIVIDFGHFNSGVCLTGGIGITQCGSVVWIGSTQIQQMQARGPNQ
jgi:hypothetical protein